MIDIYFSRVLIEYLKHVSQIKQWFKSCFYDNELIIYAFLFFLIAGGPFCPYKLEKCRQFCVFIIFKSLSGAPWWDLNKAYQPLVTPSPPPALTHLD